MQAQTIFTIFTIQIHKSHRKVKKKNRQSRYRHRDKIHGTISKLLRVVKKLRDALNQ
ncbi:uncharacterized protein PHALS_03379 [Plasmopara halstedii]|uniref:Uncharacterized protein n=1 Tax=Plasmopara halstedii TaxID=4781 RepID=A0A0N7L3S8_PLAHL|nr:uncharacterized protein PHALS_03379 [Plasmopara halstedii]CEG36715.1 hypothetical protein PHALS_03379 [Plasmopara halstedii]|eukprot:XP_024573084.1 hypothetical protein PHALS_03379 [Plasmopara halstedii]